jgi:nucleoside-diphosphate-sugar epimerase
MLDQVRCSQIVLPARGLGLCNAVYVDDVVAAMMSAVECDAAIGEAFLISGSAPITWREFYGAYEKMLGMSAILALDDAQVRIEERRQRRNESLFQQLRRAFARRPALRKRLLDLPPQGWLLAGGRWLLPDPVQAAVEAWYDSLWSPVSDTRAPLYLHDLETRALYRARTNVRIDKARKMLGYKPAFDLRRGMALTSEWGRWANLC